jgi:hypothetical protein
MNVRKYFWYSITGVLTWWLSFFSATFPRGDIYIKEGDSLDVYCRLNLTKSKGYNASFIQFFFTKSNVSRDAMKTTVLNETTAMLRVERMNASSLHLSCEIVPPNATPKKHLQVCQNGVTVGCKSLMRIMTHENNGQDVFTLLYKLNTADFIE